MGIWPRHATKTREPGGTEGAELIRNLLVVGDKDRWDGIAEALLMTAARRDNLTRIIRPALAQGEAVITDRFYDSTTVYQGMVGGVEEGLIAMLNRRCLDGLTPDITILLDIDPSLGLKRSNRSSNDETRFEDKGLEFHNQVRAGYLSLAKANPERFLVIDAARDENTIHDDIKAEVEPRLKALIQKMGV